MRCQNCSTVWPEEIAGMLKFCGACGAPLKAASPQTPETLTQLTAAGDPGGELRYVAVLFSDIVGFTSFAEDRPADEISRIVGGLLQRLGAVVEQHGGAVYQFLGDAVVATFGLPRPDPNAARNATRAGLALQDAVAQFNRQEGFRFDLRVGIHAGEVMFRALGGNWTMMGDTMNTASRIQSAAPPGRVWLSRPVYEEIRRFFTLVPRPAVELKGKKQSVQPYEVLAERSTPLVNLPRFVGRQQEWEQIQELLRQAVEHHELRIALIRGSTGVGKSRLVWELRDWVQRSETLFRFDLTQYDHSERLPSHGLNTLIRGRFNLPLELDDDAILTRLRAGMPRENPTADDERAELAVEFFAFALGVLRPDFRILSMDGKGKWEGAFVEIKSWIEKRAARAPWIWILEDTQKGDADTAAFLDWAQRVQWSAPVLILLTIREEDFSPDCYWHATINRWLETGGVVEIRLREIPPAILALALTTMTEGAVSESMAVRIAEHTEGNPLFATELILYLKEQKLLDSTSELENLRLPGSIREVMEARLERLGADGKEVAKRGALMGRRFTREAVERIWQQDSAELDHGLNVLRETETIYEEISKLFSGEIEQVFRHGRLQEAALARIPREERLRWLEGLEDWARAKLLALSDSWEAAGTLLIPLIARSRNEQGDFPEASLWFELLGALHFKHHRTKEAAQAYRHALAAATGVRLLSLTRLLAESQRFSGEAELALETINRLEIDHSQAATHASPELLSRLENLTTDPLALWAKLSSEEASISLELERADTLSHLGNAPQARQAYELIEGRLQGIQGETAQRLWLRWGKSWSHFLCEVLSEPRSAERVCQRIRQQVDLTSPALARERLAFLAAEGLTETRLGRFDRVRSLVSERLELARACDDRRDETGALNALGLLSDALGKWEEALASYEKSLLFSRAIGYRRGEVIALHNEGLIFMDRCDWQRAQQYQLEYLAISRQTGNRPAESYAPAYLGVIELEQGHFDTAENYLNQSLHVATENSWPRLIGLCRAFLGRLRLAQWLKTREVSLLNEAVSGLDSSREAWRNLDEAGELYACLAVAFCVSGIQEKAVLVVQEAIENVDASWLAARAWLDFADSFVFGKSCEAPLSWFRLHGYLRAEKFILAYQSLR